MGRCYARGKIYQIKCQVTGAIYIGSTTKKYLQQRLQGHERDYRRWKTTGLQRTSSIEVLINGNYRISMLDMCPCDNKAELLARERHYIEANPACVNRNLPGRLKQEYRRAKVADVREYNKEYQARPEVKERMKEQRKRYEQTEAFKSGRAYRDKMKYDFGDLYCNSLTRIAWDVFA